MENFMGSWFTFQWTSRREEKNSFVYPYHSSFRAFLILLPFWSMRVPCSCRTAVTSLTFVWNQMHHRFQSIIVLISTADVNLFVVSLRRVIVLPSGPFFSPLVSTTAHSFRLMVEDRQHIRQKIENLWKHMIREVAITIFFKRQGKALLKLTNDRPVYSKMPCCVRLVMLCHFGIDDNHW